MTSFSPRGIFLSQSRTEYSIVPDSKEYCQYTIKVILKKNPDVVKSLLKARQEDYDHSYQVAGWIFFYQYKKFTAYDVNATREDRTIITFDIDKKKRLKFL